MSIDNEYTYTYEWVAVTYRGYDEEPAVCSSYADLIDFINSDDEDWDYVPALRVRCFPTDYGSAKIASREGHLMEALAFINDGFLDEQTEVVWPTRTLRLDVPLHYRREVAVFLGHFAKWTGA